MTVTVTVTVTMTVTMVVIVIVTTIVTIFDRVPKFKHAPGDEFPVVQRDAQIIVVMDQGSASASEFLAAGLRDRVSMCLCM